MNRFRWVWASLNFDKVYLFGFEIVILFHNITGFTLLYFLLYEINAASLSMRDFFKKDITDSKLLNSSVCAAGRAAGQVDYQQRALRSLLQYTTEYC